MNCALCVYGNSVVYLIIIWFSLRSNNTQQNVFCTNIYRLDEKESMFSDLSCSRSLAVPMNVSFHWPAAMRIRQRWKVTQRNILSFTSQQYILDTIHEYLRMNARLMNWWSKQQVTFALSLSVSQGCRKHLRTIANFHDFLWVGKIFHGSYIWWLSPCSTLASTQSRRRGQMASAIFV